MKYLLSESYRIRPHKACINPLAGASGAAEADHLTYYRLHEVRRRYIQMDISQIADAA
jgi:hypothetical protein